MPKLNGSKKMDTFADCIFRNKGINLD